MRFAFALKIAELEDDLRGGLKAVTVEMDIVIQDVALMIQTKILSKFVAISQVVEMYDSLLTKLVKKVADLRGC